MFIESRAPFSLGFVSARVGNVAPVALHLKILVGGL